MTFEQIMQVFGWGIDYGLLLAEQERDSEDLFDAVGCAYYARKFNVPSAIAPRRQPRSDAWRQAKKDAFTAFIEFIKHYNSEDE